MLNSYLILVERTTGGDGKLRRTVILCFRGLALLTLPNEPCLGTETNVSYVK